MRWSYALAFALLLLGCERTPPPQAPSGCGCSRPEEQPMYVEEKPANPTGHFNIERR